MNHTINFIHYLAFTMFDLYILIVFVDINIIEPTNNCLTQTAD